MEKLKVEFDPRESGVSADEVLDAAKHAGWSDDPGTGRAVLIPDANGNPAYEVLNPMPFAPPIGWEPTPPIEELIRDRVKLEVDRLRDEDEIDDVIDAEDFDVDDELPPLETIYEVIAMKPEAPALPKDSKPDLSEKAKADAEYLDLVERERLLRKRHRQEALKKAKEEVDLYESEKVEPPPERREPE